MSYDFWLILVSRCRLTVITGGGSVRDLVVMAVARYLKGSSTMSSECGVCASAAAHARFRSASSQAVKMGRSMIGEDGMKCGSRASPKYLLCRDCTHGQLDWLNNTSPSAYQLRPDDQGFLVDRFHGWELHVLWNFWRVPASTGEALQLLYLCWFLTMFSTSHRL